MGAMEGVAVGVDGMAAVAGIITISQIDSK
jgi:hypothetical protein